jgi:hypothetical protein
MPHAPALLKLVGLAAVSTVALAAPAAARTECDWMLRGGPAIAKAVATP